MVTIESSTVVASRIMKNPNTFKLTNSPTRMNILYLPRKICEGKVF